MNPKSIPKLPNGVDVREEYANALRTESYIEFWRRVQALCINPSTSASATSAAAARLPSYRLFALNLLDPDQPTAVRILNSAYSSSTIIHSLLSEYFTQTANASLLCGLLLKDIERVRTNFCSLKNSILSVSELEAPPPLLFPTKARFPVVNYATLNQSANTLNQFIPPTLSLLRVRAVQTDCHALLRQLESSRDGTKAKLRLRNRIKHCSAIFLVALTASLTVIVATHALALLVAAPNLVTASFMLVGSARTRRLARKWAQLDAAAKGTYILSRDLDTISRLVSRLGNELEHKHGQYVKYRALQSRPEEWLHGKGKVLRILNKNDDAFTHQLDELEEHLYLCFMTINRARTLVHGEIL